MADSTKTPLSIEDYEAIEAAVMETSRGRWFLAEFARRNRHAETERLLESLNRIERAVSVRDAQPDPAASLGMRRDLADIADRIARTRQDIVRTVAEAAGATTPPTPEKAFDELVALVEQADTDAFEAAEQIQEIAWSLREITENPEIVGALDDLDRHATDVYRATNRHTLATTRVRAMVAVLRGIEARIHSLLGGERRADGRGRTPAPAPPPPPSNTAARTDIAFSEPLLTERRSSSPPVTPAPALPPALAQATPSAPAAMASATSVAVAGQAPAAAPSSTPGPAEAADARLAAFSAVDALSLEQKLALFA